jgi:hypothetical protein
VIGKVPAAAGTWRHQEFSGAVCAVRNKTATDRHKPDFARSQTSCRAISRAADQGTQPGIATNHAQRCAPPAPASPLLSARQAGVVPQSASESAPTFQQILLLGPWTAR